MRHNDHDHDARVFGLIALALLLLWILVGCGYPHPQTGPYDHMKKHERTCGEYRFEYQYSVLKGYHCGELFIIQKTTLEDASNLINVYCSANN